MLLPELRGRPASQGNPRRKRSTADKQVRRVLLSLDDRLATLHSSECALQCALCGEWQVRAGNEGVLRGTSTQASKANVGSIFRRHARNSEIPREAIASSIGSWLEKSDEREREIAALERVRQTRHSP